MDKQTKIILGLASLGVGFYLISRIGKKNSEDNIKIIENKKCPKGQKLQEVICIVEPCPSFCVPDKKVFQDDDLIVQKK